MKKLQILISKVLVSEKTFADQLFDCNNFLTIWIKKVNYFICEYFIYIQDDIREYIEYKGVQYGKSIDFNA